MKINNCIAEMKKTYICFTIIFCLLFLLFKIMTFGWLTIFILFLIPIYLVLYCLASILTACIKHKTKGDHIRYWCLSSCLLLSGLTFCDFGDVGPTIKLINFLPEELLLIICLCSVVSCIILSIILITIYFIKNKKIVA